MNLLLLILPVLLAQESQQEQRVGQLQQSSSGPCSVNIAAVQGNSNVTISCPGIPPALMSKLNKLLNDNKDIHDIAARLKSAEDWRKKYEDLVEQLASADSENGLSRKAEHLIEQGRLDEAQAVLDQLIADDEKDLDRVAADHFHRGQLYALQFDTSRALRDFERAHQIRPDEIQYALNCSQMLILQHKNERAIEILEPFVPTLQEQKDISQKSYILAIEVLGNLASAYQGIQSPEKAEELYVRVVALCRAVPPSNAVALEVDCAANTENLAGLYMATGQVDLAEQRLKEVLAVRRELAKTNRALYEQEVIKTEANLGTLS